MKGRFLHFIVVYLAVFTLCEAGGLITTSANLTMMSKGNSSNCLRDYRKVHLTLLSSPILKYNAVAIING